MKNYKSALRAIVFLTALILLLIPGLKAQSEFPVRPEPQRLVNDFAGVLSGEQQAVLENKLVGFNQKTSTQIAIVIVKSLSGYDKADFAVKLSEKWGIGQKGKNNGILILVKPKVGQERGEVFVAVGYGLEAVVPDAVARQSIVGAELLPAFKQNDYYTGLDRSTDVLMSLTAGEYTADQYVNAVHKRKSKSSGFVIMLIVLAVIFLAQRRSSAYGIGSGQGFLGTLLLMDLLGGNRGGGSWNDFSGGGGSSGGESFGGFGGGSFGGGGAGGSW